MEEDIHICGRCRQEYRDLDTFCAHKKTCVVKNSRSSKDTPQKPTDSSSLAICQSSTMNTVTVGNTPMPSDAMSYIEPTAPSRAAFAQKSIPEQGGKCNSNQNSAQVPSAMTGMPSRNIHVQPSTIAQHSVLNPGVSGLVPVLVKNANGVCLNFLNINKVNQVPVSSNTGIGSASSLGNTTFTSTASKFSSGNVGQAIAINQPMKGFPNCYLVLDKPIGKVMTAGQVMKTHHPSASANANSKMPSMYEIAATKVREDASAASNIPCAEPAFVQPEFVGLTCPSLNSSQELDDQQSTESSRQVYEVVHVQNHTSEQEVSFVEESGELEFDQKTAQIEKELVEMQQQICQEQVLEMNVGPSVSTTESGHDAVKERSSEIIDTFLNENIATSMPGPSSYCASNMDTPAIQSYDQLSQPTGLENSLLPTTDTIAETIESTEPDFVPGTEDESLPKIMTVVPKRFECSRCGKKFQYKKDLDRHFRIHTGDKPFQCHYCDKRFSRTDKRKIHERTHTGDKPYKCVECEYKASEASSLKAHMLIHQNLKPYRCQMCSYAARTSNALTVHLRIHTGDSPYVCYVCQSTFKIKSDLNRHLRIHNGDKPFKCTLCEYRCSIKGNLDSHMKFNHCKERMQKCKKCSFETSSRRRLAGHMAKHRQDSKSQKETNDGEMNGLNRILPCDTTDVTVVGNQDSTLRPKSRIMKCTMCAYSCTNKMALTKHKKVHLKPYQCKRCSFSSTSRKLARMHLQEKHPDKSERHSIKWSPKPDMVKPKKPLALCEKKFRCSKCDAAFVRPDSLRCHMRNHMETEKVMAMTVLELQNPFTLSDLTAAAQQQEGLDNSMMGLKDTQALYEDVHVNTRPTQTTHSPDTMLEYPANDLDQIQDPDESTRGLATNAETLDPGNDPDRNTAVLSQAASNLLAFMENQHNHAMEDNMMNLARQRAMNSASRHNVNSPDMSGSHNDNHTSTGSNVVVRQVNSLGNHWSHGSTGLLSLAEQALDTDGDMLLSNHSSVESTSVRSPVKPRMSIGDSFVDSGSNSPMAAPSSLSSQNFNPGPSQLQLHNGSQVNQMPLQNHQSSWEQLQQAVLQSVNLQSPKRENAEEEVVIDNRNEIVGLESGVTEDSKMQHVNHLKSNARKRKTSSRMFTPGW